jgi:hypothetical protein
MLELALLCPLLSLLMLGVIEFGRAYYFGIEVTNAARAGAQYACQSLANAADNADITTAAESDAPQVQWGQPPAEPVQVAVTCECSGSGGTVSCTLPLCSGDDHLIEWVQVKTAATYQPLFKSLVPTLTLQGQATMRVSQ